MIGRLRLWSGYVLFFYVVTHLLNHTLGLISLRVLEAGRHWFVLIWHNPIGQTVLYGALFGHFFLALWSLYRRRALKLSSWEWTQWILGVLIIPLGAIHVVGTRLAPRTLRRRARLSLGAGLAGGRRLDQHRPAIRARPRRLAACLHRPALRLAPAALVSHLAAAALRHRPAGAGGRHRRRRHRLARRRRPRPAAGLPRNLFERVHAPTQEGIANLYAISRNLQIGALVLLVGVLSARPLARPVGAPRRCRPARL